MNTESPSAPASGAARELRSLWVDVEAAVAKATAFDLPAIDHVEGIRYSTELARLALTLFLHNNDPDRPSLVEMINPTMRWAWDNPYTTYHHAFIDGSATYRIYGRRNDSLYLGITVYGGGQERRGEMPAAVVGSLNDTAMGIDADGHFDIILSATQPENAAATWLRLDGDASSVIVRQYFADPYGETPATVHIERIPAGGPPPPLTDAELAARLANARRYFATMWAINDMLIPHSASRPRNDFFAPVAGGVGADGRPSGYMYPTRDNVYTFGRYEITESEALLVTFTPPPCRYWNFYLGTEFQQSMPYGVGYGLLTRENTSVDADGVVRVVISEIDPGLPNWLPTQGHRRGVMAVRYLLPEPGYDQPGDVALPQCRVVPLTELGD